MEHEFDVEAYASQYRGHGLIWRLLFIARQAPHLRVEALQHALRAVRATTNTSLYEMVRAELESALGPHAGHEGGVSDEVAELMDGDAWVVEENRKADQRHAMLEGELQNFLSHRIRESIRMGHTDLAEFHYDRGDLEEARKAYLRARDYCTNAKQTIDTCLSIATISLEQMSMNHAHSYCTKCRTLLHSRERGSSLVLAKVSAISALAHLHAGNFESAATSFLAISPKIGDHFNHILCQKDVALYASMCALATFSRAKLKAQVLENEEFVPHFELAPQIHTIVQDFCNSRYARCLDSFHALVPELVLDLHLSAHVEMLVDNIRRRAVLQYCSSYKNVLVSRMEKAFNVDASVMEKDALAMIKSGELDARFDAYRKCICARTSDSSREAYRSALEAARVFESTAALTCHHAALVAHDLVVRTGEQQEARNRAKAKAKEKHRHFHEGRRVVAKRLVSDARTPDGAGGTSDGAPSGDGGKAEAEAEAGAEVEDSAQEETPMEM